MNAKKELLSKLRSKGIKISEEDLNSFKELYESEINMKIATEAERGEYDKKLMEAAPKLRQIAEMYHDHMLGNKMEHTMIFDIVKDVLFQTK